MKKKIAALLRDGSLAGNAEYAPLHKAHQSSQRAFERARKEKTAAKSAYRDALANGEKDHDRLLELLTAFRQAKYMQRYHSAGFKLNKHKLYRWLESWLKVAEVPHEPEKAAAAKTKSKKTLPVKARVKKSTAPKVAGKQA